MTQITNQLLISTPLLIGLIAVGVAALALFVYGWCVRFSRIGWSGAQVLAVFGGTLLLALIPNGGGLGGFFISVGGTVGITVVVLLLGGLLRGFFRRRPRRAKFIFRLFDHILGSLMALLNVAVPLLAVGGAGLVFAYYVGGSDLMGGFFTDAFWTEHCAPYALDLLISALFVATVKGGYRLGFVRSIWSAITFALAFGVAVLSVILIIRVPFLYGFANMLAGAFSSVGVTLSYILGYALTYVLCTLVLLSVVMLLHFLIHLLVKQIDKVRPLRFADGAIMTVLLCVFTVAIICGVNFGVYAVADTPMPEAVAEMIPADLFDNLTDAFCSSPIARAFYESNPIRMIGG